MHPQKVPTQMEDSYLLSYDLTTDILSPQRLFHWFGPLIVGHPHKAWMFAMLKARLIPIEINQVDLEIRIHPKDLELIYMVNDPKVLSEVNLSDPKLLRNFGQLDDFLDVAKELNLKVAQLDDGCLSCTSKELALMGLHLHKAQLCCAFKDYLDYLTTAEHQRLEFCNLSEKFGLKYFVKSVLLEEVEGLKPDQFMFANFDVQSFVSQKKKD